MRESHVSIPQPGSGSPVFKVLVVDDEPETAAAHAKYVNRVPGFSTGAIAANGQQALGLLASAREAKQPFDLVLLDMTLPDLHGIDVAKRMRGRGLTTDIIAITAVRDLAVVRSAVATGITQYLIKPFAFAAFTEKLENHRGSFQRSAPPVRIPASAPWIMRFRPCAPPALQHPFPRA